MSKTRCAEIMRLSGEGYNCAQAVACAYADVTGLDHKTLFKITETLGGGMGRMQETCGALIATYLVMSHLNSDGGLSQGKTKLDTYDKTQVLHDSFVAKLGSSNCKVLLKGEKPKHGVCDDKLQTACDIIEDTFHKMGIQVP